MGGNIAAKHHHSVGHEKQVEKRNVRNVVVMHLALMHFHWALYLQYTPKNASRSKLCVQLSLKYMLSQEMYLAQGDLTYIWTFYNHKYIRILYIYTYVIWMHICKYHCISSPQGGVPPRIEVLWWWLVWIRTFIVHGISHRKKWRGMMNPIPSCTFHVLP